MPSTCITCMTKHNLVPFFIQSRSNFTTKARLHRKLISLYFTHILCTALTRYSNAAKESIGKCRDLGSLSYRYPVKRAVRNVWLMQSELGWK